MSTSWPDGAYEFVPGAWYVPYRGTHGGPFSTPEEARAWIAAVDARDAAPSTYEVTGTGPIPVHRITPELAEWLWYRHHDYKLKTGRDLFFDLLSGSMAEINNAKKMGDLGNPGMTYRVGPQDNSTDFDIAMEVERLFAA